MFATMSKNKKKRPSSYQPSMLEEGEAPPRVVAIPKAEKGRNSIALEEDLYPEDSYLSAQASDEDPFQDPPEQYGDGYASPPEPEDRIAKTPPPVPRQRKKIERIGDLLREARLDMDEDLYAIAEYLRIKPAFLIALENSRYDELPADAYVIGFLRTYANFLGIDGKAAVDRYRYEMAGRRKKPVLSMPTPVSEGRAPSGIVMGAAAVALFLIYLIWYGFSSSGRSDVRIAPPLPSTSSSQGSLENPAAAGLTAPVTALPETTTAPEEPSADTTPLADLAPSAGPLRGIEIPPASPGIVLSSPGMSAPLAVIKEEAPQIEKAVMKAPEKPKPKEKSDDDALDRNTAKPAETSAPPKEENAVPSRITVRARQNTWVMIVDNEGKALLDRVLKAGESYKVPDGPGLSLTTGNGSGIVVSLDGKDLPRISGDAGQVVRNIPLDPKRLQAELGKSSR